MGVGGRRGGGGDGGEVKTRVGIEELLDFRRKGVSSVVSTQSVHAYQRMRGRPLLVASGMCGACIGKTRLAAA